MAIGGATAYTRLTADGPSMRLRLSVDDCDHRDLFAGRQVRVAAPGRSPANALVTAVAPHAPFAWVEVESRPASPT